METFDFPYHRVAVEYPDSDFRLELGNSYVYTAQSPAPDQREFILYFETMRYYEAAYFKQEAEPVSPTLGTVWINTLTRRAYRYDGSVWIETRNPSRLNIYPQPEINAGRLEDFYFNHRTWKKFIYPHPLYGDLAVRFNKPLSLPKGVINGGGIIESFEVRFLEVPGGL